MLLYVWYNEVVLNLIYFIFFTGITLNPFCEFVSTMILSTKRLNASTLFRSGLSTSHNARC